MSFVERQPSTLRQSNVSETAFASARRSGSGSTAASVVSTASIVAIAGESIAAPLAIPPTIAAPAGAVASFGTVSVVIIARAASAPPSASMMPQSLGMPASSAAIGIGMPMSPVEQTSTSEVAAPMPDGGELAHARRVAPARLAGGGVGVARAEHDRGRAAVGEVRARDLHRRGLREVRREHRRPPGPAW